ncbi:MAG: protein kinase [Deltaproteobacteria bacterium]|nr:protein kinase [Deltaproteobacteria bacterium]
MRSCPSCGSVYNGQVEFCGLDGARLVESESDPLIGATIDRYVIVDRLGAGGMACVYRATHQALGKDFAVKVLFGEMAADRAVAERFRREAQAAGKIDHANIVQVIDYGTTAAGLTYMVMEMIHGRSLAKAISEDGPFPPERIIDVAHQIATGLSAAHDKGFVHRDMKPGNVMLVPIEGGKELVKILDFGLVRVMNQPSGADSGRLTKTGHAMGTPYYMAPEQIRGEEVTAQSDLYALGAVMYEMISGRPPFMGSLTEVLVKHATERPEPLPPLGGLERLAEDLLEKVPSDRPASAQHVLQTLEQIAEVGGTNPARNSLRPGVISSPRVSRPKLEVSNSGRGGLPPGTEGAQTYGDRANLREAFSMDSLAAVEPWWRGRIVIGGALVLAAIAVGVAAALVRPVPAIVESIDVGVTEQAPTTVDPRDAGAPEALAQKVDAAPSLEAPKPADPPKMDPERTRPDDKREAQRRREEAEKKREEDRSREEDRKREEAKKREEAARLAGPGLAELEKQIRDAMVRAGVSRDEACSLKPANEHCRALDKAKAAKNDGDALTAARAVLEAIPNLEVDRDFVDRKIESAVGTLSRLRDYKLLSDTQVQGFDARILDLRASLMSSDASELLQLSRKAANLESEMHAASRSKK